MADETRVHTAAAEATVRLIDLLADLVADRFASRVGVLAPPEYTSKNLPAAMSRRTFHDRCKRLADAGDARVWRRGRAWVALRDAIDEPTSLRRAPTKPLEGPWSPGAALAAAGARARRK